MRVFAPNVLLFACAGLLAGAAPVARATTIEEKRVELLFRPVLGERLTLSPDGHYLAYTQHVREELRIVVMDLQRFETKTRILADEDRPIPLSKEKARAQLRFLEWADNNRLVFAPMIEVIAPAAKAPPSEFLRTAGMSMVAMEPTVIAPIMAVDADGTNPRQLADAKDFQFVLPSVNPADTDGRVRTPRPEIIGFPAGDRDHILLSVRKQGQPTTTEVHRLDVHTGKISQVSSETGSGFYAYDQAGNPRMAQEWARDGSTTFSYRAPDSGRWVKMPEPLVPGLQEHFGRNLKTYYEGQALPLGFDYDPNVLIYASSVGRDTYGIYGMNLTTRQRTTLALESPHRDLSPPMVTMPFGWLVFDKYRQTFCGVRVMGPQPTIVWVDPELAAIQRSIAEKFPQRTSRIFDWDEARERFIVQVSGGTEPGRTYLFQRSDGLMVELLRRAPWLPNADLHETRFVEFPGPDGSTLSAQLTLPRAPRLNPPPVIIWFAPGLPPIPHPEFDPQAQVLADMGFVVCRLNNRGVLSLGARQRDALRHDPDHTPSEDALAALEWVAAHHRVDRKRVATMGQGFAGHLAVRATQLHPGTFRCAVAIDPIINLLSWVQPPADASGPPSFTQSVNRLFFEGGEGRLHALSTTSHPDELNTPLFIITRSEPQNAEDSVVAAGVEQLRSQLKRRDLPCVTAYYNDDYVQGLPGARTRVYRELEEFFNLNLYNYEVRIGPTRVVK